MTPPLIVAADIALQPTTYLSTPNMNMNESNKKYNFEPINQNNTDDNAGMATRY